MARVIKKRGDTESTVTAATVVSPPPAPIPQPAPAKHSDRPVVYEKLGITEYSINSEAGPLTADDVVSIMGWQTEEEYQTEMVAKHPESKPEDWAFGDTSPRREDNGEVQPIHCVDMYGNKVVCWNNANNRLMDEGWTKALRDKAILDGLWAGPLTIPGATVNGETIRISRAGEVLSGQHSMTALKWADELLEQLRKDPMYEEKLRAGLVDYPFWGIDKRPVIETIIITGLSDDERVLQTIDYVKPRDTADMFYTMKVFRSRTPVERKEMTRMLASAIDFLWVRTATKGYKTHPEVVGFLDRHKRLMECVEHLFLVNRADAEDGGRKISKLKLQPGMMAALCYLMGSSGPGTDGDEYRNECPPSERNLDWSLWDRAKEFWVRLAGGKDVGRDFIPVRTKLNNLAISTINDEENQGMGGRIPEKLAVLAKAWEIFKDHPDSAGPAFNRDDVEEGGALMLNYDDKDDKGNQLPEGKIKLLDIADFKGIDDAPVPIKPKLDSSSKPDPAPPTREEIEKATEQIRKENWEKEDKKQEEKKSTKRRAGR